MRTLIKGAEVASLRTACGTFRPMLASTGSSSGGSGSGSTINADGPIGWTLSARQLTHSNTRTTAANATRASIVAHSLKSDLPAIARCLKSGGDGLD